MQGVGVDWSPTRASPASAIRSLCRRLGPLGRRMTYAHGLFVIAWQVGLTRRHSGSATAVLAIALLGPRLLER
eukprot:14683311-Alexandrium_andersonii.AAC.1